MKDWKTRLGELEPESLRPRTLAELYGAERLLVERHRGIVSYSTECIRIGASCGTIVVTGQGLNLCCMSRSQVVIRGKIQAVSLEGGA